MAASLTIFQMYMPCPRTRKRWIALVWCFSICTTVNNSFSQISNMLYSLMLWVKNTPHLWRTSWRMMFRERGRRVWILVVAVGDGKPTLEYPFLLA